MYTYIFWKSDGPKWYLFARRVLTGNYRGWPIECLSAPSTNYDIQVQTWTFHYGQSCPNGWSIQNSLNTWLHCNPSKQGLRHHYCLMISCFKNSRLSMRPRTPIAKMLSTLVRLYSSTMICGITPMIHRMPQGISCHAGLLENYWWYHGRHGWLPVKRMQRYPWNDKIQIGFQKHFRHGMRSNVREWDAGDHTQ